MQVKMSEYYQGTGVSAVFVKTGDTVNILAPNEIYEVDNVLGQWLVDNGKATESKKAPKAYGAQAKPEFRDDEVIYKEQTITALPEYKVDTPTYEEFKEVEKSMNKSEPIMTTKKKGRK